MAIEHHFSKAGNTNFIFFEQDTDIGEMAYVSNCINVLPFGIMLGYTEQNENNIYYKEIITVINDMKEVENIINNIIEMCNKNLKYIR